MKSNHELSIIMLSIEQIAPFQNNPRKHPPKQIAMLESAIRKFGFNNPLLLAPASSSPGGPKKPSYELIAGHARVIAARNIGMTTLPVIILPHLSEAERRAYRIADNAIALKGEWSLELLKTELEFVYNFDVEFDAKALGFEAPEVDAILFGEEDEDSGPGRGPDRSRAAISMLGTIWSVEHHRIMCGSSLDSDVWLSLMAGKLADLVLSDMPFNVPVSGHITGSGNFEEFAMASGELSEAEFAEMIAKALTLQAEHARDGSLSYQFIDWRSVELMIREGRKVYNTLINLCVWVKSAAGMGSTYRSQHELIPVFRKGKTSHRNNVELGKHGRYRTNIWEYSGCTGFSAERKANLAMHPTVKNTQMIADAIMDSTGPGDLVVDAFIGSGTTALAAERIGRICYGIEIDPHYTDLAVSRLIEATGGDAADQNGRSYRELLAERDAEEGETQ